MKANMLSLHTPATLGWGQKVILFLFSKSGHVSGRSVDLHAR